METPNGKWYAVFLGCRPYEDNYYNIGRETFMAPVRWENDWPIITTGDELVQYHYSLPQPNTIKKPLNLFSGNFIYTDEFITPILSNRFRFLRTITDKWYNTSERKGF